MEDPSSQSVFLSWKDLCVSLPAGAAGRNSQPRFLLQNVSGFAEPGSLLAIMGPSGCGKSTLLNVITGRLSAQTIFTGEILVNGREQRVSYGNSAFVTQDNSLIATLTTYETLIYSAHLQLPDSVSSFEKHRRVQDSIRAMGLQECVNTRVGNWYTRGLSGGQKRRLSIAIDTLRNRPLLLLDEPTSGLDSAAAFHVVKRLLMLAKSGRSLLVSIHQPSSEVFELFDNLCLLSGGKTVYFGKRLRAQEFFDTAGFPCPTYRNPSDHFLWVVNSEFEETEYDEESGHTELACDRVQSVLRAYANSDFKRAVMLAIEQASLKQGELLVKDDSCGVSLWRQIFYLTSRSFTNMRRDIAYYWLRVAVYAVLAVCVGTIYFKVGHSFDAIEARARLFTFVTAFFTFMGVASFPSFVEDLKIFTRERLNGHYGVGVFVMANFLSSFPFIVLLALIPGLILYPLCGLHPGFTHFIFFVITLFTILSVQEGLMVAIASFVPDYLTGMIVGCGIMGMFLLNGGYSRLLRNLPKPVWRYPMSYFSFHTWGNRAFYNNDLRGLVFDNRIAGSPPLTGEEILDENFGLYVHYSKWWPVVVLFSMSIIYRIIFILAIKLRERLPALIMKRRMHARNLLERQSSARVATSHDMTDDKDRYVQELNQE